MREDGGCIACEDRARVQPPWDLRRRGLNEIPAMARTLARTWTTRVSSIVTSQSGTAAARIDRCS
jgi:hypothetical protein